MPGSRWPGPGFHLGDFFVTSGQAEHLGAALPKPPHRVGMELSDWLSSLCIRKQGTITPGSMASGW